MSAPRTTTDGILVCFGLAMVAGLAWFVASLFDLAVNVLRLAP